MENTTEIAFFGQKGLWGITRIGRWVDTLRATRGLRQLLSVAFGCDRTVQALRPSMSTNNKNKVVFLLDSDSVRLEGP